MEDLHAALVDGAYVDCLCGVVDEEVEAPLGGGGQVDELAWVRVRVRVRMRVRVKVRVKVQVRVRCSSPSAASSATT